MNVLLIGSGGREHALALKISESKSLTKLYISPGNPGTKSIGENINLDLSDKGEVSTFCSFNKINLIVIGPEQPIVEGLGEYLRSRNFLVFGPDVKAAEIEAHKSYAKQLMNKNNIPTAKSIGFNSAMYSIAKEYLLKKKYPCVIKVDGLAAGKGVMICKSSKEALKVLEDVFINKIFGDAGEKILVEEFLSGQEASIFAITDGEKFVCLPSAQDHKRIGNNDTGKNTGGMGAYAPAPVVTPQIQKEVEETIIKPTLKALKDEGRPYSGCLYVGIMITAKGPKVIEFNCRFGDPETQVVLPLLKGDFLKLLYSAAKGKLNKGAVKYKGGCSVCVVAASNGYPDNYVKGYEISGLDLNEPGIIIYHAGTKEENGKIVTNGGRVLGITSVIKKNDLRQAKQMAYKALDNVKFHDIYYRKDIADKAIH